MSTFDDSLPSHSHSIHHHPHVSKEPSISSKQSDSRISSENSRRSEKSPDSSRRSLTQKSTPNGKRSLSQSTKSGDSESARTLPQSGKSDLSSRPDSLHPDDHLSIPDVDKQSLLVRLVISTQNKSTFKRLQKLNSMIEYIP